jgi:hypothetical protein
MLEVLQVGDERRNERLDAMPALFLSERFKSEMLALSSRPSFEI